MSGATGETMTLRDGLVRSKNTITVQVMRDVGIRASSDSRAPWASTASKLDPVPSLALGTKPGDAHGDGIRLLDHSPARGSTASRYSSGASSTAGQGAGRIQPRHRPAARCRSARPSNCSTSCAAS
jgi:hypothetical protein